MSDLPPPSTPREPASRHHDFSSMLEPSSPAHFHSTNARFLGSPSVPRYRRSELSSTLLGDDIGSPLAYPSTPSQAANNLDSQASGRTPRTTQFVRTPLFASTPRSSQLLPQGSQAQQGFVSSLAVGSGAIGTQETDPSLAVRLIWGTTVNVHEVMTSFRSFLENFTLAERKLKYGEPVSLGDDEPFYPKLLKHVSVLQVATDRLAFCRLTFLPGSDTWDRSQRC